MPKPPRYRRLPDEDLRPEAPLPDVSVERQADAMRELRDLANAIPAGYELRDDRMLSLAHSNSLSRRDMAIAVGLVPSRVDQIIRGRAEHLARIAAQECAERVDRHLRITRTGGDR